jgi:hypothetical protein
LEIIFIIGALMTDIILLIGFFIILFGTLKKFNLHSFVKD